MASRLTDYTLPSRVERQVGRETDIQAERQAYRLEHALEIDQTDLWTDAQADRTTQEALLMMLGLKSTLSHLLPSLSLSIFTFALSCLVQRGVFLI